MKYQVTITTNTFDFFSMQNDKKDILGDNTERRYR